VGGLLGSQIGGGKGHDVMAIAGAVGGGFAGNEVEKRVKSTKSFAITIRLDDGTTRVFNEAAAPAWRAGDKVRLVNGNLQSNG
jgi:outer membrane lipoprotein SlyB